MKYEVQYSSYVNVTSDGFVILKRVVKTESFALQVACKQSAFRVRNLSFIFTDASCCFLRCKSFSACRSERWIRQQGNLAQLLSLFRSYLVRPSLLLFVILTA